MSHPLQQSEELARRRVAPSFVLMHPTCLLSTALLVFNDHWLKVHHPGVLSGKVSDFAGLLLLPLVAHTAATLLAPLNRAQQKRALWVCVLASAIFFTLLELSPEWALLYEHTLAVLQSPVRLAASTWVGQPYRYAPGVSTLDLSDLLALPMLGLAWKLGEADLVARFQK